MKLIDIARVCYDTNRSFCIATGDVVPPAWEDAQETAVAGYLKGVEFRIANPMSPAQAQHDLWCKARKAEGWIYGPEKDEETQQHPNLVPYTALPMAQRLKDTLFKNTVVALAPLYFAAKPEEDRLAAPAPVL
uniref:RyR domain containing protein n=1 Tax=Pseudomonas phage Cygsa01 TaxID=3138529 RepID=A0AAU6W3R8_9VIRU